MALPQLRDAYPWASDEGIRPLSWGGALVLFVLCQVLMSLPTFHPIYDAYSNMGDETASLTQAYTAVHDRLPSYGYRGDGEPWMPGVFTLPAYFLVYGTLMNAVEPLERLPAARELSRIIVASALFLFVLTLLQAQRENGVRGYLDVVVAALAIGGVVLLFTGVESFLYVGSFARVDAGGLFCVALFALTTRLFLRHRTEWHLALVALVTVLATFSSYLAGALCALDATVLGVFHLVTPFTMRRVTRSVAATVAVLVAGAAAFAVVHFVVLHGELARARNDTFESELGTVASRFSPTSLAALRTALWTFPGLSHVAAFVAGGCVVFLLCRWLTRRSAPGEDDGQFGIALVRLGAVLLAGHLFFAFPRLAYAPMLFVAALAPFLAALLSCRRWPAARLAAAAALPILVITWVPGFLPFERQAADADQLRVELNATRDAHLRSLFDFLDRAGIHAALVSDPLFCLLDGPDRKFYFVYDPDIAGDGELGVFRRFAERFGAHHLISTEFGQGQLLGRLGAPVLKAFLVAHPRAGGLQLVPYAGGRTVRVERVFKSTAPISWLPMEYRYGDEPSTPFYVYRIDATGE